METKKCSKCGEKLGFDKFYRYGDKIHSECKKCTVKRQTERKIKNGWVRKRATWHKVIDGYKICSHCNKNLPITSFWKTSVKRDLTCSWCKECSSLEYSKWRLRNKQKRNSYLISWKKNNPEKHREANRKYKEKGKKFYRENWRVIVGGKRVKTSEGYIELDFKKYRVKEHIHIMRKHLNKFFTWEDGEVHHINGIRDDNRIENLEFIPKYPNKEKHRVIDQLHKSLKTIAQQDQEIARLKELLAQKEAYGTQSHG